MNSTLIMSCGTVDLLRSWHDNIITNGLSNCVHIKDGMWNFLTLEQVEIISSSAYLGFFMALEYGDEEVVTNGFYIQSI